MNKAVYQKHCPGECPDEFNQKVILLRLIILLLATCLLAVEQGQAGSPWHWEKVLKHDKEADALIMPSTLFIDVEKELYYIVDSGRDRLLSFNKNGELQKIFNAGKALRIPFDLEKTSKGGLWVIEKGRNSLSYIDLKEKSVTPNVLTYQGRTIYPDRLESDQGLLYVIDKQTGNILSFTENLEFQNIFSCSQCPWGFVDFKIHKGKLWALDQANKSIRRFDLKGNSIDGFILGDSVNFPVSLAIGPNQFIYVLDRQRRNIAVYDKSGIFKYRFLQKGIARGQLYYPSEIRFDPWGGLCVVDEGNGRVEIFKR